MEYVVVGIVVGGLLALIVARLNKPKAKGTSTGGRARDGVKTQEK